MSTTDLVLRVRDLRPGDVVTPTRFRVSAVYVTGKVARVVGAYPGKDQRTKGWGASTSVRVERPAPEPQIVPDHATLMGHGRRCIQCNSDYTESTTCRCGANASLRQNHPTVFGR